MKKILIVLCALSTVTLCAGDSLGDVQAGGSLGDVQAVVSILWEKYEKLEREHKELKRKHEKLERELEELESKFAGQKRLTKFLLAEFHGDNGTKGLKVSVCEISAQVRLLMAQVLDSSDSSGSRSGSRSSSRSGSRSGSAPASPGRRSIMSPPAIGLSSKKPDSRERIAIEANDRLERLRRNSGASASPRAASASPRAAAASPRAAAASPRAAAASPRAAAASPGETDREVQRFLLGDD